MVTILPIDIDDDFAREALQSGIAERIAYAARELQKVAADLAGGGTVQREEYVRAFLRVDEVRELAAPVLEYARAFTDQHDDDDES